MASTSTLAQIEPVVSSHTFGVDTVADLESFAESSARWYAVFTFTRHEKRVFAQCAERKIEAFLPLYKVRHQWKNRQTVDVELPLFPSYAFVHIDPRTRVQVLQLRGVISMVSSGRELIPVPDDYVRALRCGLLTHRIQPHPGLTVGDRVRITAGPLTGAEGILERRKNDLRVVLRLEMLARSVSVEVAANEIESCGAQPRSSIQAIADPVQPRMQRRPEVPLLASLDSKIA